MSGHSKWATIKRQKAATDAVRGRIFTKLANAITIAARQGGGDPNANATLRYAIDRAKASNMPNDNIERSIKRGTGELAGSALESFTYELVGPAGAALLVEGVTDNKNRTASEIRNIAQAHSAKVAEPGSQRWQFERVGSFMIVSPPKAEEAELAAIEANAHDTQVTDEGVEVLTQPNRLAQVRSAVSEQGFTVSAGEMRYVPKSPLQVTEDVQHTVTTLAHALLERDDVQNVWVNVITQ